VWQKNLRVGGNSNRDNAIYPYQDYANAGLATYVPVANSAPAIQPALPPKIPANVASYGYYRALNKFENYGAVDVDSGLNSTAPTQHMQFNYIYDLPFGRGKQFFAGANRLVNELIGGYQIAGDGQWVNQNFSINSENWGPTASSTGASSASVHVYKHKYPITDCTSGTCYHEYLWWNGYVSPISNGNNPCSAQSGSKVVNGLPSGYAAYQSPMDTYCTATSKDTYYGDNEVTLTFLNGKTSNIAYQPGPNAGTGGGDPNPGWSGVNPFAKTVLPGPFNFNMDASIFKVFPLTEQVNFRFNMDVFNVLNNQGSVNPSGSTGEQNLATTSFWSARQVQFSLRLTF
jgi:hypothetical protein